jgi:hypothetical protein
VVQHQHHHRTADRDQNAVDVKPGDARETGEVSDETADNSTDNTQDDVHEHALAKLAVDRARNPDVPEGNDGISYLINAKKAGIVTPLSGDYEKEILRLSGTASLEEALAKSHRGVTP